MFCPKCAAQNQDDAKYCRGCGADISLVTQAVSGELTKRLEAGAHQPARGGRGGSRVPPSMESGVVSLFMGIAFGIIAFFLSRQGGGGNNWWFYMLIPTFIFLGKGIGTLARVSEDRRRTAPAASAADTTLLNQPPRASALPPRETGEIIAPPPSVTEATTRHLGVPVERRPKDV